jgi:hypothetical protein
MNSNQHIQNFVNTISTPNSADQNPRSAISLALSHAERSYPLPHPPKAPPTPNSTTRKNNAASSNAFASKKNSNRSANTNAPLPTKSPLPNPPLNQKPNPSPNLKFQSSNLKFPPTQDRSQIRNPRSTICNPHIPPSKAGEPLKINHFLPGWKRAISGLNASQRRAECGRKAS